MDVSLLRTDPEAAAREAALRYVSDEQPGYTRRRRGRGFAYYDDRGEPVSSERLKARFAELVIPPAWQDVWICKAPNGHLQATGTDEQGRKQYLYHPRWREVRDRAKFATLLTFAEALPEVRRRVAADLKLPGLPKAKLVAAAVTLLETTLIRIGNREYAQKNKHYGLTTLRKKHVTLEGTTTKLTFVGKSGVKHALSVRDRQLARVVRACSELPGYELFKYETEDGDVRVLESDDVNAFLKEAVGEGFTAKDFRTWAACLLASELLCALPCPPTLRERRAAESAAVKKVAARLGHTVAVCRASYIHPRILGDYGAGCLLAGFEAALEVCERERYRSEHEAALVVYLR